MDADNDFRRTVAGLRRSDVLTSATISSATEWMGVGAEDRERALRDLLELADAVRPYPPREFSLPEKVSIIHRTLDAGEIPHAIGGAVAVAYYGEPRSTGDLDVNVFILPDRWPLLRDALRPLSIEMEIDERELRRFGEIELDWDSNLLHLFLSTDPLHDRMKEEIKQAPFKGATIPIVSPEHLVVRKAILDRPKDWLDIEQMLVATSPLDLGEIREWLERMVGKDDPRMSRLLEVESILSAD
jgi:hypothetical protein